MPATLSSTLFSGHRAAKPVAICASVAASEPAIRPSSSTRRGGSRCLRDAIDARVLARLNRWRPRRLDRGCEQVAAGGVDALLRRRRRRRSRLRRSGGGRRRCRRRSLVATVATSGSHRAQRDESGATSDSQRASTHTLRTHSQSSVCADGLSLVLAVDPRRFSRGGWRDHRGCEQIAARWAEILFCRGRRRRCGGRRRRRSGSRSGRRRRRCLIAAASTSCENRAHGDESCCATSDSHHARTDAIPLHHAGPLPRVNHYQNSLRLSAYLGILPGTYMRSSNDLPSRKLGIDRIDRIVVVV